jgi:hypothetical protein
MPLGIWCSTVLTSPMCTGVPGVGAALVAHHPVGALGEHVDQLALALVAPLGADDDERTNGRIEHDGPGRSAGGDGTQNAPGRARGVARI